MSKMRVYAWLLICVSPALLAASPKNTVQIGAYVSSITYKEPSVMKEKGTLDGLKGVLSSHQSGQAIMLDLMYSSGDMDYNGSGKIKNIPDRMFDVRGMLGHDYYSRNNYRITPYIGLGYRNLNDNSSYLVSSTNAVGYEREQTYWYRNPQRSKKCRLADWWSNGI